MISTSPSLLLRLRDPRDTAGWERFVSIYTPLLYRWTKRLGINPEDTGDLLQDLFVCLLQCLPTFEYDPAKSFRGWLRTILVNRWHTWQRRRMAMKQIPHGEARLNEIAVTDSIPEFEEEEYRRHLVVRILELMKAEFPETTWKACWEYVVCERTPEDVSKELGISVNSVYLAKSRVLRHLREELSHLLD